MTVSSAIGRACNRDPMTVAIKDFRDYMENDTFVA